MVEERTKKMQEELETINNSLKGTKTIESASVLADIPTTNSKDDMFKIIKKLYNLSKKALSDLAKQNVEVSPQPTDIQSLIKQQLTDTLPGLLKEALHNHSFLDKTVKDSDVDVPVNSHTIVIEKLNEGDEDDKAVISEEEWTTVVKKDVKKTLKSVPVIKARSSEGSARLHFKSKEHMDQAKEALQEKYKVTSKTREIKKLDPKVTIADIDSDVTSKEVLVDKLLEKNDFLKALHSGGGIFKVVFFDEKDRFAVLQVSPEIREAIKQRGDKLCLDLQQHLVRDRIHVIQCYHCQEYGHMSGSPFCKQKDSSPTCFYCAGPHKSKDCKKKMERNSSAIKCANCEKSKNRWEKSKCTTHKASDTLCPSYVWEKEKIMSRTAGCEEAKNLYLQRVKELQRKYGRV